MNTRSVITDQVLKLTYQFLDFELTAEDFCTKLISLWAYDRDKTYEKQKLWSEPYDQQLISARQRGELTAEAFQEKWAQLWGINETIHFREMFDCIHSACYVFRPSPQMEWEISEEQLRSEVLQAIERYEESSDRTG